MTNVVKLLGFVKGVSREGKPYVMGNFLAPYGEKAKEKGCFGSNVVSLFLPKDFQVEEKDIGKEYDMTYYWFQKDRSYYCKELKPYDGK